MSSSIIKSLLHRKLFRGQFKLFFWLYNNNWLKEISTVISPIIGHFKINVNTKNFIDANIFYTGDYEPYLKVKFKELIKEGDIILDVGANIGFHTLYFAELTGKMGKVIAFEPIPINFNALQKNINLNDFNQILIINKALGNTNTLLNIHINPETQNPGAFNLFDDGVKNLTIACVRGDDYLNESGSRRVDFIKVDVEGFELEVFKGLEQTIKQFMPIIIFEYDKNYQAKINDDPKAIFHFLSKFAYMFFTLDGYGNQKHFNVTDDFSGSEILASPIKT